MEQKLLTAVVQYAQQMLYFGKQRVERQIGEMRMMGAQMERERKKTWRSCLLRRDEILKKSSTAGRIKNSDKGWEGR